MDITKVYVIFLVLISLQACSTTEQQEPQPPNIVLIFADDLGIGDTSIYGSQTISTPNIDGLAESGVRFSQGYVSHPVCSPSRAGIPTGRYQQRHGWEFNPAAGLDVIYGMSVEERTFADAMKERGYATGMVGKWHLEFQDDRLYSRLIIKI